MILISLLILHQSDSVPTAPPGFRVGLPRENRSWRADQEYEVSSPRGKLRISKWTKKGVTIDGVNIPKNSPKMVEVGTKSGILSMFCVREQGIPFQDGELFTADKGEFGGLVAFLANSGSKAEVAIEMNAQAVGVLNGEVILLSGLSHLGDASVTIFKLSRIQQWWSSKLITSPKFVPSLACWNGFRFIVGWLSPVSTKEPTRGSFTSLIAEMNLDGSTKPVASFDFEKYSPRSMAITPDGTIWFGGLGYIAALTPIKKGGGYSTPTFFVPK